MKIETYLQQSPIFVLNAVYEKTIPRINKELKDENLNLLQGLVLTALFFEDRSDITPSILAKTFQTTKANMSHIISNLESTGLIKRTVNQNDARVFYILLKPDGKKKALQLIKYFDEIQETYEQEFGSASLKRMLSFMMKISDFRRL